MRTCLCMILLIVLSLTIPFTSACAYGGGGGGGGEGGAGGGSDAVSVKSDTTNPPSGFTPTKRESTETETSSGSDPGDEEKVAELVDEVKAMGETTEEGEVEGNSKDSAEEAESDEKAADDREDKKDMSEDGTDKTENITIGVRRFLSQLTYALPQGMQPAADAVDKAAERAERVKHINDFFDKCGFRPPDLSDDKNLEKVENLVRETERNLELQDEINKNLVAATKHQKEREALQLERDKQLECSRADALAIVKFGMDVTVTILTSGTDGLAGPITSIVYSAATSDDPIKGGAVQTAVEVATPAIVKRTKPFGSKLANNFGVNFGLAKTEEAAEYGLSKVLEQQQQRDQLGQQTGQSIDTGVQSVPPSN